MSGERGESMVAIFPTKQERAPVQELAWPGPVVVSDR